MTEPRTWGQRVALIVVDVPNDFADPAGSLTVAGGEEVVGIASGLVPEARAGGGLATGVAPGLAALAGRVAKAPAGVGVDG